MLRTTTLTKMQTSRTILISRHAISASVANRKASLSTVPKASQYAAPAEGAKQGERSRLGWRDFRGRCPGLGQSTDFDVDARHARRVGLDPQHVVARRRRSIATRLGEDHLARRGPARRRVQEIPDAKQDRGRVNRPAWGRGDEELQRSGSRSPRGIHYDRLRLRHRERRIIRKPPGSVPPDVDMATPSSPMLTSQNPCALSHLPFCLLMAIGGQTCSFASVSAEYALVRCHGSSARYVSRRQSWKCPANRPFTIGSAMMAFHSLRTSSCTVHAEYS